MGSSEPMMPIEEKIELRWTEMKVYFPLARAKKLIPDNILNTNIRNSQEDHEDMFRNGKARNGRRSFSRLT
jgi:hypothetical protein